MIVLDTALLGDMNISQQVDHTIAQIARRLHRVQQSYTVSHSSGYTCGHLAEPKLTCPTPTPPMTSLSVTCHSVADVVI